MRKWTMVIDVEKCEDCNSCFLACKDEHVNNEWPGYACGQPLHGHRWMNIMRRERGSYPMIDVAYRPTPCMQCEQAPCLAQAENDAIYKRKDGIVIIDADKAVGQRQLVKACPYQAIWWNEERNVAQKCTMCAHLLDSGWQKPRCVQSCPTGALRVEQLEEAELNRMIAAEGLETLHPEYGTKPRVYYRNLYRYARCFVGGSLAIRRAGLVDCAAGARVILYKREQQVVETTSDSYGDFKFDGLEKNSGVYKVVAELEGHAKWSIETEVLAQSLNLGVIHLELNNKH